MSVVNASEANAALESFQDDRREETLSKSEALATKRRLEQRNASEQETVTVGVDGEEIAMHTLQGLGEKTHLARRMIEAERKGDREEALLVQDDMIQRLADKTVHDDVFGREFWNSRPKEEIKEAFQELGLKSRGGGDAGN